MHLAQCSADSVLITTGAAAVNDTWSLELPKYAQWPAGGKEGLFIDVFDWDSVVICSSQGASNALNSPLILCTGFYPCALLILGLNAPVLDGVSDNYVASRSGPALQAGHGRQVLTCTNGSLHCLASAGCTSVALFSVQIECNEISTQSLFVVEGTRLDIRSASIVGCASLQSGGAVHCTGANSATTIESSVFQGARSGGMGGAIHTVGCAITIYNTNFTNCTSVGGGGAISAAPFVCYGSKNTPSSRMNITGCRFDSCSSNGLGGAVFLVSGIATITSSHFISCTSNETGGAVSAVDQVELMIAATIFQDNLAMGSGGAVAVSSAARATVAFSSFRSNTAGGDGGGGLFADGTDMILQDVVCTANKAISGGGGAILWHGKHPPIITNAAAGGERFCGGGNMAAYGNCVATRYRTLAISGLPDVVYPGIPFYVAARKQDAYNQTISTDSRSVLQIEAVGIGPGMQADRSTFLTGKNLALLNEGVASFSVTMTVMFSAVDLVRGITLLRSEPSVYVNGLDYSQGNAMTSEPVRLAVSNGSEVCPKGYVLILESALSHSNLTGVQGTCVFCRPGTYSLNPLIGVTPTEPSCMPCPIGGDCQGGSNVNFALGTWKILRGAFVLIGCPSGHQLVNSIGGIFSQSQQSCVQCRPTSYILDPNNPNYSCHGCPIGAVCNGSALKGLVQGSVWVGDGETGLYRLMSCPAGYTVQAATHDNQQCLVCPAANYCPDGLGTSFPCPAGSFSAPGANSSIECLPVVFVEVIATLPITLMEFTPVKKKFLLALGAASGVDPVYVMVVSVITTSAISQRTVCIKCKFLGSMTRYIQEESRYNRQHKLLADVPEQASRIVLHIATPDSGAASKAMNSISRDSLNRQLLLQGLPPGTLESVLLLRQVTSDSQNNQAMIVGSVMAGVVVIIGLCITFIWWMMHTGVAPEEAALAKKVQQLRARFRLTKVDGYMMHGEKRWWDRGRGLIILRQGQLEALARFENNRFYS